MKLEDFFTLTEMSNGLTSPSRVQELVSLMQKERESVVKNAGETTKQWSAVARTIAATENKECLELFIQLDGLSFIQSWLKDALRFGSETAECFVDESISHSIDYLLRAVERLHVDDKKSVSSGIWQTVKSLLGHSSSKVQERAKALFDSWDTGKDDCMVSVGTEKVQASIDDGTRDAGNLVGENGLSEPSPVEGGCGEEKSEEHVGNNAILSSRSDIHQSRVGDTATSNQTLEHTHMKDAFLGSSLSNSVTEDHKVEQPTHHAECANDAIDMPNMCASIATGPGAVDEQADVPVPDSIDHIKEVRSADKFNSEVSKSLEDRTISLITDVREALDAVAGSDLQKQTDVSNESNCSGKSSLGDASVADPVEKTLADDSRPENHYTSKIVLEGKESRNCNDDILQDSDKYNPEHPIDSVVGRADKHTSDNSEDKHTSDNSEDKHTSDNSEDKHTSDNSEDKHTSDNSEDDIENESEFQEAGKGSRDSDVFGKTSDIDFDYGIMDPLELARQVAIEVEREVQSCSSSDKIVESKVHEPGSPDSISAKQCEKRFECPNMEVSRGIAPLTEPSLDNSEARPCNGTMELESSQVVDATLDLETNAEKGLCGFDLNLEVCSDDVDSPVNPISTSVSVVSASRAAAAPGVPSTPLQFEGTLGWKGSAATSAFRPASPRRIPAGEKAVSSGGNDSSSKQMQCFRGIDLNVSESGDDRAADLFPEKKVSLSSALPLGKSSPEASSRKSEMLEWDLNCASEEGEAPSDWRMEGTLLSLRNGHLSQSPSSSSSSKQPSLRNFDLNDQSSFLNDFSNLNNFKKPPQNLNASGGIKSRDSVVTIMGMKVEVNRKDSATQPFPFPNGRVAENAVEHNVARGGGVLGMGSPFQYTPLPAFGYSGIAPVPPMAFSSSMYGPSGHIPYMVDSRGAPVVPQIGGSASAMPPSFSQQPFILNMGSPPVPNGVWPSRSTLDLDTGLVLDRGNKDVVGLRPFFDQGQARPMNEPFSFSLQPSTSLSIGGKRKEPDGGWEPHHPPPWK
ncbi:dentin sialophosphoprotein [Capsicum galapagoense]